MCSPASTRYGRAPDASTPNVTVLRRFVKNGLNAAIASAASTSVAAPKPSMRTRVRRSIGNASTMTGSAAAPTSHAPRDPVNTSVSALSAIAAISANRARRSTNGHSASAMTMPSRRKRAKWLGSANVVLIRRSPNSPSPAFQKNVPVICWYTPTMASAAAENTTAYSVQRSDARSRTKNGTSANPPSENSSRSDSVRAAATSSAYRVESAYTANSSASGSVSGDAGSTSERARPGRSTHTANARATTSRPASTTDVGGSPPPSSERVCRNGTQSLVISSGNASASIGPIVRGS